MVNTNLQNELIQTAHALADAARVETLRYFRGSELGTDNKDTGGGFDPVTLADRASEKAMRAVLAQRRPDDGIFGEEFGVKEGSTGLRWVLDPIDGTRAFLCGTASWGVLISIEDETGPLFGMIDQPYMNERFIGGFGKSELVYGSKQRALQCRRCGSLDTAIMMTTFPEIGTVAERAAFDRVKEQVKLTRYGLDCYGYALVALGQIDLVIEAGLSAYDISAPIAVIEAAGGIVTDWQGGKAHQGGQVLACGDRELHATVLKTLSDQ